MVLCYIIIFRSPEGSTLGIALEPSRGRFDVVVVTFHWKQQEGLMGVKSSEVPDGSRQTDRHRAILPLKRTPHLSAGAQLNWNVSAGQYSHSLPTFYIHFWGKSFKIIKSNNTSQHNDLNVLYASPTRKTSET